MYGETRSGPETFFLNALRIVVGFNFWQHGAQKLFGWLGGSQVESLMSLMGVAGVLEFFGGLAILLGLFTRPVAFVLAGEMAVAYFMAHVGGAETMMERLFPIMNGGEGPVLFCFTYLYFVARGGGNFSIDGWLKSRRQKSVAAGSG